MRVGAPKNRQPWGAAAGIFHSYKRGEPVEWQSILMYETLFHFDCDPTVRTYEAFPVTITRPSKQGKREVVRPHLLVEDEDGIRVVLCKWSSRLQGKKAQLQIKLTEEWAARRGIQMQVITEKELRTGFRPRNLRLMWRFRKVKTPPEIELACLDFLMAWGGSASIADLASHIAPPDEPYPLTASPYIYNLLFRNVLTANINTEPLKPHSFVRIAEAETVQV